MSSTIDYQRKAYTWKDEKFGNPYYIVLHETGASNVCDAQTGRRSRDWRVLVEGPQYQVCREIAEYAGHSAGGMLRLNRMGAWSSDFTDVLRFIRAYDKTLKNALPIEKLEGWDFQLVDQYRKAKLQNKGA